MIQVSFLPRTYNFIRVFPFLVAGMEFEIFNWWIFLGQNYWHQVSPYKSSTEVTPVALQPILHSDCWGKSISMYHVVQSTQGL